MSRIEHEDPVIDRDPRLTWQILLIVPVVVGALTGLVVGLVVRLIEDYLLETVVLGLPGLWFAVPAMAVFVLTRLALLKVAGTNKPGTAELYPHYYHHPEQHYPTRQTPGRILSGATTVGLGGSQGLESQSVLIGSTIGILLRRLFRGRLDYLARPEGRNLLLVCGASAGIATVFSSPILGALYGLEMPFRNRLDARRLIPAVLAAGASFGAASLTKNARSLLTYVPHEIGVKEVVGVLIVGVLCGAGARGFVWVMEHTRSYKDGSRPYLRAALAGVALSLLAMSAWLITGSAITAGPGYVASDWALPTSGVTPAVGLLLAALVIRAISVLLCVAAGGGGGVFTSMAVNGILLGTLVAAVLGLENPTLLALAGACAFLGAGYRLPLATAGLLAEVAGAAAPIALGLIAIGIAMVFMGSTSASSTQTDARSV